MEATTVVINNARVKWAKVLKPDDQYPPAKWSIDIYPDAETCDRLRKAGVSLRDKGDGPFFQAKRKTKTQRGQDQTPPRVVGPDKQPWTDLIGNGSVCNVIVKLFEYTNYGGGVTAFLEAVQVVNHVPFQERDEAVDFDGPEPIGGHDDTVPF